MKPLTGKVALVAGATRGAGRGIARMLGEAGATVYASGRGQPTPGRPETLEETAALVDAAGGRGVAVHADHRVEAEVAALVARIEREEGRLDVLVNDVWGGDALTQWGKPFWELDVAQGFRLLETAVHTHVVTARHAAPLLMRSGRGLIVEITDGDAWWYRGNLFHDLAKTSVIRLAFAMAEELRPRGVASLAVTPGFLRSEAMLDHFGVTEETWREGAKKDPHFLFSETPAFVGRAVAALAADPRVLEKSGRVFASWTLAREYGFTDLDGSRPDWGAHFLDAFGPISKPADETFYSYWQGWDALRRQMGGSGGEAP